MNKKGIALTEPFDDYPSTFEMNLHNTFNIVNYKGCNININYTDMTFNAEKIEKQNNRYVTQETYGFKTPSSDRFKNFTVGNRASTECTITKNNKIRRLQK